MLLAVLGDVYLHGIFFFVQIIFFAGCSDRGRALPCSVFFLVSSQYKVAMLTRKSILAQNEGELSLRKVSEGRNNSKYH